MLTGYISEGNSLDFEVFACGIKNYNVGIAGKILFTTYCTLGENSFILRSPTQLDQNLPDSMDFPSIDTAQNKEEANLKLYEHAKNKLTQLIKTKFPGEEIHFHDCTSFAKNNLENKTK